MKSEARREYERNWRLRNPEKVRGYERKRVRNPELKKGYNQSYRLRHPGRSQESFRLYKLRNPGYRERLKVLVKAWRLNNPDKIKSYDQKRRARIATGSVDCSNKILELRQVDQCFWCGSKLDDINRTVDHVRPLDRGGTHSPENLVACCKTCNSSKHNKLYWEWDGELAA